MNTIKHSSVTPIYIHTARKGSTPLMRFPNYQCLVVIVSHHFRWLQDVPTFYRMRFCDLKLNSTAWRSCVLSLLYRNCFKKRTSASLET